jgi:DNA-binding NtrC family response regulator
MKAPLVLLVDDEIELIQTMVERLALRGIVARAVTSGEQALDCMEKETFDVIFVDVKMPGQGGIELLSEIKRQFADQKVILVTGHGSAEDAKEGLRLGAYDYLMKPINIDTICNLVREITKPAQPQNEILEEEK